MQCAKSFPRPTYGLYGDISGLLSEYSYARNDGLILPGNTPMLHRVDGGRHKHRPIMPRLCTASVTRICICPYCLPFEGIDRCRFPHLLFFLANFMDGQGVNLEAEEGHDHDARLFCSLIWTRVDYS